jgi:hypothetical protein
MYHPIRDILVIKKLKKHQWACPIYAPFRCLSKLELKKQVVKNEKLILIE